MATHSGHRSSSKNRGKSSRGSYLQESVLSANRWFAQRSGKKYKPEEIIVLCPHCLQNSSCEFKILLDAANCRRCGKCVVKDIVEITGRHRVPIHFVAGGSAALNLLKAPKIKAVIAVACGRELFSGLMRILDKRVITVHNEWPNGPCKDTAVDFGEIEKAIELLIG